MQNKKPESIDEYINAFPEDTRDILQKIRMTIRKAVPGTEEVISYGIPCMKYKGKQLIFFAAFTKHIGLYPAPRNSEPFKKILAGYKGGKGTVQFPLNEPIPYRLISRITKYRAKANLRDVAFNAKKNRHTAI